MWCGRSRALPYLINLSAERLFQNGTISERVLAAMNADGSGRPEDYITVDRAENKAFPSLVRTAHQAWLKLTTHRAFVTITGSLEA